MTDLTSQIRDARLDDHDEDVEALATTELATALSGASSRGVVLSGDVVSYVGALPYGQSIPLPVWVLDEGETVTQVLSTFVLAGADVVVTPTLGCGPRDLAEAGLPESALLDVTRHAVRIARQAAAPFVLGAVDMTRLADGDPASVLAQAQALCDCGVHGLLASGVQDATASLQVIKQLAEKCHEAGGLPLVASFACDGEGFLPDGASVARAYIDASDAGATCLGVEGLGCTDCARLADVVTAAATETDCGLLVRPDKDPGQKGTDEVALSKCASIYIEKGVRALACGRGFGPSSTTALVHEYSVRGV